MKDWILIILLSGGKTCGQIRKILFSETLKKATTYDVVKKALEREVIRKRIRTKVEHNKLRYYLTPKGNQTAKLLREYYDGILEKLIH